MEEDETLDYQTPDIVEHEEIVGEEVPEVKMHNGMIDNFDLD